MLELREFLRALNPNKPLDVQKAEDRAFYINFSAVRGGTAINRLKNQIVLCPDMPTCALFSGHIGCGKSTELLRLKSELERDNFHVVYFESSDDLEINDIDIVDVLLAIARRIALSLEKDEIHLQPRGFKRLLQETGRVLNAEVTGLKFKPPKFGEMELGEVGAAAKGEEFSISFAIGELTAKMKDDSSLRRQMNQYLGPKKTELLNAINGELLEPAIARLQERGKSGLAVIIDDLDRIINSVKSFGRPQQEYLFVDQAKSLKLNCDLVYTIPLRMLFSESQGILDQRFDSLSVLPMVPIKHRDGTRHEEGMELLRQMVLARAFPEMAIAEHSAKVTELFESAELLDRVCEISGGHVRDLLIFLREWVTEETKFPLTQKNFDRVARVRRNNMTRGISEEEQQLLEKVKVSQRVSDEEGYKKFIQSRYVFEYQDDEGSWYALNPILEA